MGSTCGKCCLEDTVLMAKAYPTKGGYTSDIMESFEYFREKTHGVIYQRYPITVTKSNQKFVAENNSAFKIIENTKIVPDKRYKSGNRKVVYDTYEYYGKKYDSLKKLNNECYLSVKIEIHFKTIFELLPYFPYLISSAVYSDNKYVITITRESYVESQKKEFLQFGCISSYNFYNSKLAELYQDIFVKYFADYKDRTIIKKYPVNNSAIKVDNPIDENFAVHVSYKGVKIYATTEDEYHIKLTRLAENSFKTKNVQNIKYATVEYITKNGRKKFLC